MVACFSIRKAPVTKVINSVHKLVPRVKKEGDRRIGGTHTAHREKYTGSGHCLPNFAVVVFKRFLLYVRHIPSPYVAHLSVYTSHFGLMSTQSHCI